MMLAEFQIGLERLVFSIRCLVSHIKRVKI